MAKEKSEKYEDFTGLKTWQEAHKLALNVFQTIEQDGIANEGISKAHVKSLEITSNIARGFYKKSFEEKVTIYYSVLDSMIELDDTLLFLKDMEIVSTKPFEEIREQLVVARKMTFSLIAKLKEMINKEEKK
jgi:four helix bundle protein